MRVPRGKSPAIYVPFKRTSYNDKHLFIVARKPWSVDKWSKNTTYSETISDKIILRSFVVAK